jgi:predicted membrane-bound mannosyltransferase
LTAAAAGGRTAMALAAVLALALVLRLVDLGGESFWADEAFT